MLDIELIRENPELVKANLQKRGDLKNLQMLKELIRHDRQWRENLTRPNDLRHQRKQIIAQIAGLKKKQQDATKEINQGKRIDAEITTLEKQVIGDEEERALDELLCLVCRMPLELARERMSLICSLEKSLL